MPPDATTDGPVPLVATPASGVVPSTLMPTTITFDATLEDVAALASAYERRTGRRRREWIRPAAVAAFCLLAGWNAALAEAGIITVVGLVAAGPALAFLVHRVRAAAFRRAMRRAAEDLGILGRRTVTLGSNGISASSAHGESMIRWDTVEVVRTERHLLLFAGQRGFGFAVPVSTLGDAAGVDRFVAEIERHRAAAT
jgi:hypothetical protein